MKEVKNYTKLKNLEIKIDVQAINNTNKTIAHFMPDGFESYCKIFYPVYEDLNLKNDKRDWSVIN